MTDETDAFNTGCEDAADVFGVKIADALARAIQRGAVAPSAQNAQRLKAQFPADGPRTTRSIQHTLAGMSRPSTKKQEIGVQSLRRNLRESKAPATASADIQERAVPARMSHLSDPSLSVNWDPEYSQQSGGAYFTPQTGPDALRVTPAVNRAVAYQKALRSPVEPLISDIKQDQLTHVGTIGMDPMQPTHRMRPALEHEVGERWMARQSVLHGRPTTPYASHYGPEATVRELGAAATNPQSWRAAVSDLKTPEGSATDRAFMPRYTHVGGTRDAPVPADSRQSRAIQRLYDRDYAKMPAQLAAGELTAEQVAELRRAQSMGLRGLPLTPGLEHALQQPNIQARLHRRIPRNVINQVAGQDSAGPTPKLGFAKMAVVDDPRDEDEPLENHTARNLLMAGAAAAPWAGTIGEQPLRHYNKGQHLSLGDFRKQFRPGDVVIQGDREVEPFKVLSGASTGVPSALHAEVVGHNGKMYSMGGAGMGRGFVSEFDPTKTRLQLLRPKMTPAQISEQLRNLEQGVTTTNTYERQLRKALAAQGHKPAMIEKLVGVSGNATYNTYDAASSALKNLFKPKIESGTAIDASKQETIAARKAFNKNEGGVAAQAAQKGIKRLNTFEPFKKVPHSAVIFQSQVAPSCVGAVCSTFPAQALPKHLSVVPGKLPSEILGADYLRSNLYEPVARHGFQGTTPLHEKFLKHAPTAIRLGTGAALAGTVYGGSKLLGWYQQRKQREQAGQPVPDATDAEGTS